MNENKEKTPAYERIYNDPDSFKNSSVCKCCKDCQYRYNDDGHSNSYTCAGCMIYPYPFEKPNNVVVNKEVCKYYVKGDSILGKGYLPTICPMKEIEAQNAKGTYYWYKEWKTIAEIEAEAEANEKKYNLKYKRPLECITPNNK